jgi:hypothetical protein
MDGPRSDFFLRPGKTGFRCVRTQEMTSSTPPDPDRIPDTAFEIRVMVKYEPDGSRTITHTRPRKVNTRALPGLSIPAAGRPTHRPSSRLEVVVESTGTIRYCRPYARPGYTEAYGPDSAWTRLPVRHTQVLVALIPAYHDSERLRVMAYEPRSAVPWLDIQLPRA